jgi:hypothetical protein
MSKYAACSGEGIVMRGENQSAWEKNRPSATLCTSNGTWTDLGVNWLLSTKKPETAWAMARVLQQMQNLVCFPEIINYFLPSNRNLNTDFSRPARCNFTLYKNITSTKIAYFQTCITRRTFQGHKLVVVAHVIPLHRYNCVCVYDDSKQKGKYVRWYLSGRHEGRRLRFGRFCASNVMCSREPISFRQMVYKVYSYFKRVADTLRVRTLT